MVHQTIRDLLSNETSKKQEASIEIHEFFNNKNRNDEVLGCFSGPKTDKIDTCNKLFLRFQKVFRSKNSCTKRMFNQFYNMES